MQEPKHQEPKLQEPKHQESKHQEPIELPETLPIFPLTGVLLLPGGRLPLHIFEPRYLRMFEDVLEGNSLIGMIQPFVPAEMRSEPEPDGEGMSDDAIELYSIGCVGLVERHERLEDERFIVLLKGLRRFRVTRELALHRGYRRVEADYGGFDVDYEDSEKDIATVGLLQALRNFGEDHSIAFELERLSRLPGLALLNSVAMALPFAPAEKQALLEADDVDQRHEMLLTLMTMGIVLNGDAGEQPVLN